MSTDNRTKSKTLKDFTNLSQNADLARFSNDNCVDLISGTSYSVEEGSNFEAGGDLWGSSGSTAVKTLASGDIGKYLLSDGTLGTIGTMTEERGGYYQSDNITRTLSKKISQNSSGGYYSYVDTKVKYENNKNMMFDAYNADSTVAGELAKNYTMIRVATGATQTEYSAGFTVKKPSVYMIDDPYYVTYSIGTGIQISLNGTFYNHTLSYSSSGTQYFSAIILPGIYRIVLSVSSFAPIGSYTVNVYYMTNYGCDFRKIQDFI